MPIAPRRDKLLLAHRGVCLCLGGLWRLAFPMLADVATVLGRVAEEAVMAAIFAAIPMTPVAMARELVQRLALFRRQHGLQFCRRVGKNRQFLREFRRQFGVLPSDCGRIRGIRQFAELAFRKRLTSIGVFFPGGLLRCLDL